MSLNDLTKAEEKIKKDENKTNRRIITVCIIGIVILLSLCVIALLSSCTIKMVPAGSVRQAELQRRIAIESYKEGLIEGFTLGTDPEALQLIPPYIEEAR